MSRMFENIFDKYNITYQVPRKRKKVKKISDKSLVLHSKNKRPSLFINKSTTLQLELEHDLETTCNSMLNTTNQFYFNTSTQRIYDRPTKYKTLNVIQIENVKNRLNSSTAATALCGENLNFSSSEGELEIKENVPLLANRETANAEKSFNKKLTSALDIKRKSLSCSLNLGKCKKTNKKYSRSPYKQLDLSVIPKRSLNLNSTLDNKQIDNQINETFNSQASSSSEPSQTIDPLTPEQDIENDGNTELDLFIDLIQQENKRHERHKLKKFCGYTNDILPKTKKPLKGGYEEIFEKALKRETVSGNFLKHDRKMGLRCGKQFKVAKFEIAYDTAIAIVENEDLCNKFGIVIAPEMISQLKEGCLIEVFFDENSEPYKIKDDNNDLIDVYLEPYKLLVV